MRRNKKVLLTMTTLVAIAIGVAVWLIWFRPAGPAPIQHDAPMPLARVDLPKVAERLEWSADGKYLAAAGSSEIFIVDVGQEAVTARVQALNTVNVLAFSPDGKWLAAAAESLGPDQKAPAAELVVFDIPAFTAKFTAKAFRPKNAFTDLAWSADSKFLHAIDGQDAMGGKQDFRHWDVATFTEQPLIKIDKPQNADYKALAASPDGLTIAIAERTELGHLLIRILNLAKGTEVAAFKVAETVDAPRLGYTADGKAIGVFNGITLSWWNPVTGQSANPDQARFSIRPPNYLLSTDGNIRVRAFRKNRLFSDIGALWDGREKEFGAFVELTQSNPQKTWEWRIGPGSNTAVALSSDGTKLAGVEEHPPNGGSVVLWAMPK
jgi:hypothetical protein